MLLLLHNPKYIIHRSNVGAQLHMNETLSSFCVFLEYVLGHQRCYSNSCTNYCGTHLENIQQNTNRPVFSTRFDIELHHFKFETTKVSTWWILMAIRSNYFGGKIIARNTHRRQIIIQLVQSFFFKNQNPNFHWFSQNCIRFIFSTFFHFIYTSIALHSFIK